jgi:putative aminopeptidase FrvX
MFMKQIFAYSELELLTIPTAPGSEGLVSSWIQEYLKVLDCAHTEDRHGNLIGHFRRGRGTCSPIAFSVHMDHPGFGRFRVKKDGRFLAEFLGGVPRSYFKSGVPVDLFDARGGITGLAKVSEVVEWNPGRRTILLDTIKGRVPEGGFGMWRLPAFKMNRAGTHIVSRVCDDLAGCAAVLAMLTRLARDKSGKRVDIRLLFTRREEVGLEGAFEIARDGVIPKSVPIISIETSRALANAPQGGGAIIRVGDRSSIFDPGITESLCRIASKLGSKRKPFPFQRKLMDGGTCEATAFRQSGYRVGGLCVALGNYHNCGIHEKIAPENIRLDDWEGLVTLMAAVTRVGL